MTRPNSPWRWPDFRVLPDAAPCLLPPQEAALVVHSNLGADPRSPELASGFRLGKQPVIAQDYLVVTANPLATQAGCRVLHQGGSAMDAAVAVQLVLGLVEPQSSGIGGGAFILHYDAATGRLQSYDGRETAPAASGEDDLRLISTSDPSPLHPRLAHPFLSARASGRSIGTPGVLRMLEMAHQDYGRQTWSSLFEPAIQIATEGFVISPRMAAAIRNARNDLLRDPEASAYFLNPDLSAKSVGTALRNPDYAATLATIARDGAQAFYTGPIAESIVDKIKVSKGGDHSPVAITPGLTELSDLANYRAARREPVCRPYRQTMICGMGPPSTGGIAVAQTLGILENFDLKAHRPLVVHSDGGRPSLSGVHLISEAQRLAYADRHRYVADPDFVPLPGLGLDTLLDPGYLASRAALISAERSMGVAKPGVFSNTQAQGDNTSEGNGTTHVSLIDRAGNVVVMTSTIESGMGSYHFTRGFLLNNQLTDFSFQAADANGPIANRLQPLKRPASAMSPTLVFQLKADGTRGEFLMATGSPGGPSIIQYVVKTLVSVLDWGLDAQQATSIVSFGANNSPTTHVGGEHPDINPENDPLVTGLRALGHTVSTTAHSSGLATILRLQNSSDPLTRSTSNRSRYMGGVDPRREGIALGGQPRLDQ